MNTITIITTLDRTLKPLGFVRRKTVWNRGVGQFVDVFDIQVSKDKDAVTFNVGVLEKDVYTECWGREVASFVEEPYCTVRSRIGELIDKKDKWWSLSNIAVAEEINSCLIKHALPFFDQMHSLQAMNDLLVESNISSCKYPLPIIYLAIIKHHLGQFDDACALLEHQMERALGDWKARAKEVANRLGCV